MTLRNLLLYRPPQSTGSACDATNLASGQVEPVSVLIPARDEEATIERSVRAALASQCVQVEVVVLDDHSTDSTVKRVLDLAREDQRVRLAHAPELPEGWCGKQHACHQLSKLAKFNTLLFMDADVTLAPNGVRDAAVFLRDSGAGLVSGIPYQKTQTFLEKLLIPLIHFVLLGYLPMGRMRQDMSPGLGAGCGQLFMANREAYEAAGGHAAIRSTMHDGIMLPRAFRKAGFMTDLFDATHTASCRMYQSAGEVWQGLAKNATEGMATPKAIGIWTLLLLGGQLLPMVLLVTAWFAELGLPVKLVCAAALGLAYMPRVLGAERFSQSRLGALLHPLGVVLLLCIQWYALLRKLSGIRSTWRGRAYVAE